MQVETTAMQVEAGTSEPKQVPMSVACSLIDGCPGVIIAIWASGRAACHVPVTIKRRMTRPVQTTILTPIHTSVGRTSPMRLIFPAAVGELKLRQLDVEPVVHICEATQMHNTLMVSP
jgi:hypothetical protein